MYLFTIFYLDGGSLEQQSLLDNKFVFFLFINSRFGPLACVSWSVCSSKSQGTLWVSFATIDSGLCIYPVDHLTHPVVPCLVLLLCQNDPLIYFGINHFIVFHIIYTCYSFAYNQFLLSLVFMALFSAAIKIYSDFLLSFPCFAMSRSSRLQSPEFNDWCILLLLLFLASFSHPS